MNHPCPLCGSSDIGKFTIGVDEIENNYCKICGIMLAPNRPLYLSKDHVRVPSKMPELPPIESFPIMDGPNSADYQVSCGCRQCRRDRKEMVGAFPVESTMMIVCEKCGNKRCPHATDHRHECTNSNEPGQKGSAYE